MFDEYTIKTIRKAFAHAISELLTDGKFDEAEKEIQKAKVIDKEIFEYNASKKE